MLKLAPERKILFVIYTYITSITENGIVYLINSILPFGKALGITSTITKDR